MAPGRLRYARHTRFVPVLSIQVHQIAKYSTPMVYSSARWRLSLVPLDPLPSSGP